MNPDWKRLLRPRLASLRGYQPILPIEVLSQGSEAAAQAIIKLDGNENPYGCSPRVRQALAAYPYFHLYPDSHYLRVRQALEEYVGLSQEHIVVGSGSDELIDLVCRLFIDPGDRVIVCEPTFGMYRFYVEVAGGEVVSIPLGEGFAVDGRAVRAALDGRTKVVFLVSPNNPTGNLVAEEEILRLVGTGVIVVVDEAYYEFSGHTVAPWVPQYTNLIVLRTFSKWAGLAGLRIGYGIFPQPIVGAMEKVKPPYNVNAAAQVAAVESLADREYLEATIRAILEERGHLFHKLEGLSFIRPLPSQANFILCWVEGGWAAHLHQELRKRGIYVRYFDTPRLADYLRISVGRPQDTDALVAALQELEASYGR